MNVLIAGQAYYREDNGQATFTVRLARGLAREGNRVTVCCPAEEGASCRDQIGGVTVQRFPALRFPHNANLTMGLGRRIARLIAEVRPDIVHLQDHYFLSRAVFRAAHRLGIPVVATNHFLPRNLSANLPLPDLARRLAEKVFWRHMLGLFNRVDAVAAPTRTAAAILEAQGVQPAVSSFSCGVDTDRFRPGLKADGHRLRHMLGLGAEAITFLYVGRLDGEKGLDELIEAFAGLDDTRCRLVIAGRGSRAKALLARAAELNQSWRVLFPGFVAEGDLPGLFNAASCFVMAGHAELQSIATLEAMACGLPVLAAEACALPELVTPGKNGYLFAPGSPASLKEAMRAFLGNRAQWLEMGRKSRQKALPHDLQRSVRRYHNWYQWTRGQANCGAYLCNTQLFSDQRG